jgi:hypothetical protein
MQMTSIKEVYNQQNANIKNRRHSYMFQLYSLATFIEQKKKKKKDILHCFTASSYVDGKMYNGSRPLIHLYTVL